MEQTGEYRIDADRDTVWTGLNDPAVLCRCIDGCESMEELDDGRYAATVKSRIGPVSARFRAELSLADVVPRDSYTIQARVDGGAAGFARGDARVQLSDAEGGTLLRYVATANVGGKLAQVGNRLLDGAARKMAEDFFAAFRREMQPAAEADAAAAATGPPEGAAVSDGTPAAEHPAVRRSQPPGTREGHGRWLIWLLAFGALLIAMLLAL